MDRDDEPAPAAGCTHPVTCPSHICLVGCSTPECVPCPDRLPTCGFGAPGGGE